MAYFKKSAGCPSMLAQQVRVQRGALQAVPLDQRRRVRK